MTSYSLPKKDSNLSSMPLPGGLVICGRSRSVIQVDSLTCLHLGESYQLFARVQLLLFISFPLLVTDMHS